MLLRRLTQHVIDQNWVAVGLDLAVVVLGIFIGLQVTEWNQARKDHQEGLYYLQALETQISDLIAEGEAEMETSEKYLESTWRAVSILWSDDESDDDFQVFSKSLSSAWQFWGPTRRPAMLRQLIDGGKIDLIRSREVQKAILDYETAYVEAIQQTDTSYAYSKDITVSLLHLIRFKGPAIMDTIEELRANQDLIATLRAKAIMQRIQLQTLITVQQANQNMQQFLADHLQKVGSDQTLRQWP